MIKYRINGEYLDLFLDLKDFAITKQISKIGEINSRHGDFSTSFKVPLTANNSRILRYTPELNNNTNEGQFKRYNGQLIKDESVISDGYFQVMKFSPTKKEIQMRFFGGNSDWFDLLKDRYINEEVRTQDSPYPYNLDELQHEYNFANVTNSFTNTEGYIYFPFYNSRDNIQGKTKGTTTIDVFNVGIYSKHIFEKIFDSVDIKLEGTLFNDSQFPREVIPATKSLEPYKVGDYGLGFTTQGGTHVSVDDYVGINYGTGQYNSQWNGSTFKANSDADSITFRLSFQTIESAFFGSTGSIEVRAALNGGTPVVRSLTGAFSRTITPPSGFAGIGGSAIVRQYNEVTWTFNNISKDDEIYFDMKNVGGTQNRVRRTLRSIDGNLAFLNVDLVNAVNKYNVLDVLPRVKQTDFIKDILVRNAVISYFDVKTRTLTLNKFEDIDNNRVNSPDWTSKIDLSKVIDVDFTKILNGYAKRSLFVYENDAKQDSQIGAFNRLLPYNLGTGVLNIDNEYLSDEKDVYKSPFSSTAQILPVTSNDDFYLPFMPIWKLEGTNTQGQPLFEENEIAPRILMTNGNTSVLSMNKNTEDTVSIEDDNGQGQDFTSIGYCFFAKVQANRLGLNNNDLDSNLDTLNFENYELKEYGNNFVGIPLLQKNYNLYNKILNAPFYVSLYMNLTALDIQQLDFFTPIFLEYKYDSGYYYIDSVEQYKGDGSTTKVNLVKI